MASAQFELDPGTGTYGSTPQAVSSAGATVNCRLLSISGVNPSLISWSIVGTNNSGVATPSITTSGNPDGQIASFTIPSGANQAYIVRCEVNGGPDVTGEDATAYQGKFYVLNVNNRQPIAVGETTEGQSTHGAVEVLDQLNNQTGSSNDAALLRGITLEAATVGAPNNGDVIYYNSGTGEYVAGAPSAITLTWAQVLADGAVSGGTSPQISAGDTVDFVGDVDLRRGTTSVLTSDATETAVRGVVAASKVTLEKSDGTVFLETDPSNSLVRVPIGDLTVGTNAGGTGIVNLGSAVGTKQILAYGVGGLTRFDIGDTSSPVGMRYYATNGGSGAGVDGHTFYVGTSSENRLQINETSLYLYGIALSGAFNPIDVSDDLQFGNADVIRWERAAGGGVYVDGITVDGSDDVIIGDSTDANDVALRAGAGEVTAAVGGTVKVAIGASAAELKNGVALQWESGAASPTITQDDETTTANADDLLIKAQSNTNVTSGDGGHVVLEGGASTAGTPGEVRVKSNSLTIVRFYDAAVSGFPAFAFNGDDAASGGAAFIGMDAPTSDVATPLMVIQACGAAAATNRNGGRLELRPGLPQGAGSAGYIAFTDGSAAHTMRVHADRAEMQSGHAVDFAGEVDIQRQTTTVIASDTNALIFGSAGKNIALGADASNWRSMTLGTFVANATAEPTGNPASGSFLWSTSGALKSRSSDGLIDEISPLLQSGTPGGTNIIRRRWVEGQLGIGASGVTVLTYPVPNNTAETLLVRVNMRDATSGDCASFIRAVGVKRHGGGSAALVGTVTPVHTGEDDATWDTTVSVSGNDVIVQLTGDGSNAVDYQVTTEIQEYTP